MVAAMGCSVSVEMNSPTAPSEAMPQARYAVASSDPREPLGEPDLGARQQRHVAAAEEQQAHHDAGDRDREAWRRTRRS